MANNWGQSGTTWGQNQWNDLEAVDVTLTAPSQLTTALGTVIPFNELGWGSDTWGTENWGQSAIDIILTAPSQLTTALGTLTYAGATDGWGRDAWGDNNWGENATSVSLTGVSATVSLPDVSWGKQTWGEDGYGGAFYLNPADVMGVTGLAATSAFGALSPIIDNTTTLTAPSQLTSAVGAIIPEIGVPLTAPSQLTTALGTPVARSYSTIILTAPSQLTSAFGALTVTSNPTIQPTGVSATSAVGAISPADVMGLTGVSATSAVGAIVPADQTMGLTGVSATVTLSPIGVAPIGWGRVTANQTGNYSKTTAAQSGNWTRITR